MSFVTHYSDGLGQDCSNSIANALELLQSYAKPSKSPNHCFTFKVEQKSSFSEGLSCLESYVRWVRVDM